MGGSTLLVLSDIERAIATGDPQLGDLIVRYLAQDDPEPGRPELDPTTHDEDAHQPQVDVPPGAYTFDRLQSEVKAMRGKNATERKLARREAFAAAEASPFAPPRLRIGKLLIALYERGDVPGRSALLHVFAHAELKWGVWQAAKWIYKRAEERHDAALFGVLASRFDIAHAAGEISTGTFVYLRKRAWRYLRLLGIAVPEAFTVCCVEVMRHYPASESLGWGNHVFRCIRASAGNTHAHAWKISPVPLLRLLESAQNDAVCDFAIGELREKHPLALRAVDPAWLARLGKRPFAAIHAFVVQLLKDSPELHQSKLRALGLHDVVIGFLRSPSQDARAYALEYAAAHAPDLPVGELVELVETGAESVKKFAAARLEVMTPQQLGIQVLCRLLVQPAAPWAVAKLAQGFGPRDMDVATFVDTAARGPNAYNALIKFWNDKNATIPAGYYTALLDDRRFDGSSYQLRGIVTTVLGELAKRGAREIGVAWIRRSLEDRNRTAAVARWLEAGMLAGPDLDVEWLKSLVAKPRLRPLALALLADRRLVEPARVGLAWLLELARSSEPELAGFAQRMLLESFEPRDFGGVEKLWEMATGKKQPEVVRTFAATYLKAHHPDLGPRLPEAKVLGIKPRLDHDAYPITTVRPLLDDDRADVRRLAVAITAEEIVRWGDPDLVYQLAGSSKPEPRALGSELLMGVIVEGEGVRRVPAAWVDGRRLFQLAESPQKAAREVALTLIRRLYDRVGGAERLAWLMDSPDRDVRLFAVRLFWDRHRPRPLPEGFVPRKQVGPRVMEEIGAPQSGGAIDVGTQRFADLAALRQFARVVLFGLPPGRVGERDPVVAGAPQPERPLPASVAKRRLIESLRDVALEDVELARAIAPVLVEMSSSIAKGEWQASVQALVQLRAAHAELREAAS